MSELALKLIREAKEKRLTRLDLGNCGLTELPDELFELTWLDELMLSSEILSYDFDNNTISYFESSNIGMSNNIIEISSKLTKLSNLKVIFASKRNEWDNDRWKLANLSILNTLNNLQKIHLSSTSVKDLTPLKNLKNLQELDIGDTEVVDLKPLKNLSNLKFLNISDTKVTDLTPLIEIMKMGIDVKGDLFDYDGMGIYVGDSPIINPPFYIVEQGSAAILRYWQELENKETITNNQIKLIFIGNSRAGKTSLWQFLKDKIYTEQANSTHGIKTEIWDTEPLGTEDNQNLAAYIWDFGGQEYYHATHRLFLADNAVYVLVWEKDSNFQDTRLEQFKLDDDPNGEIEEVDLEHFPTSYWLDNIRYYGGNSPVLIVQNKVDDDAQKSFHTEGVTDMSNSSYLSIKNTYLYQSGNQEFKHFYNDSEKFKDSLLNLLRQNATRFPLIKYWGQVRETLEKLAHTQKHIPIAQLKDIALQFDETPDLENLLAYLKSFTNTVLYFNENPALSDRLYLNPTHISRDIYKILNKTVRENKGRFNIAHVQTRLSCEEAEANRYVALMKEFDLIFEKNRTIKGENTRLFVTPQYLPKKEELSDDIQFLIDGYNVETGFHLQFRSFVPRSLMLRFIANNGAFANQETYWRNGIIYKSDQTQKMIKVEYDHEKATFSVAVQDREKQTADMQSIVNQIVKPNDSDEHIHISNDGKKYMSLRTIRKLQHENRVGDIYENGELIPLRNFNWLTQKIDNMTLEQLKDQDRTLIGKAKTSEAMGLIATWAHQNNKGHIKDDIALFRNDWTDFSREKNLGLMDNSEINLRRNRLNNKVLNVLNDIELIDKSSNTMQETKEEKNWEDEILTYLMGNIDRKGTIAEFAIKNNLTNKYVANIVEVMKVKGDIRVITSLPDLSALIEANDYKVENYINIADKKQLINKPKIYFSYAWGDNHETGESREKIVEDIYNSLKVDNYDVRRDKENVGYKDAISDFMKEIGQSNFIVVAISDKYLKSPNCMFEILQIYRKSNSDLNEFKEKIYPIVLGDAKIYDTLDSLKYIRYWKEKKETLEKEINEIGLAETIAIIGNDYKNYKEITDNIALITSLISDLNTLKPELLSKDNFDVIKKEIAKRAA